MEGVVVHELGKDLFVLVHWLDEERFQQIPEDQLEFVPRIDSGAFAMACHAKTGLAQSMARELMPKGIHVCNVPIDAAIGWTREDGSRAHRLAGTTVDDNMADPDRIAEVYLQLHRQHRSTWAFEVALRPWTEAW